MNFDFSDQQKMLQEQARKFLQDKCDYKTCRRVLEGDAPHAEEVWQGMCKLGFAGAAIAEKYGGLGLGPLELCVLAEELGRAAAPVPFSSSLYLAAEALRLGGSEAQKKHWLPQLASGEAIGTWAAAETEHAPSPTSLQTHFRDGKLNGVKQPVADGAAAHCAAVLAQGEKQGQLELVLVDLSADGVRRETLETLDPTRNHVALTFRDAPAERLGKPGEGWALYQRLEWGAAVLFAFEQLGGAEAAMDMTKNYVLERYAFGRLIGSYQAVKHRLADMFVKNELARSNAYYGAMMLAEEGADLELAACAARVAASEAYRFAAQECVQLHGGIGFTWEADTQFHYRRSKLLGLNLGGVLRWKEKLVQCLERKNAA